MDKRRVTHKKYGAGTIVDHVFFGPKPVTLVLFDSTNEEMLVPDTELEYEIKREIPKEENEEYVDVVGEIVGGLELEKVRNESLAEAEEIREMSNGTLLEGFEHLIRNGAGPGYRRVIFMKREILRRMDMGSGEKEEGKDGI